MFRKIFGFIFICFLLGSPDANAFAGPREDFDGPPPRERMEGVRERIETLKMWKLTKALDLDEAASARLFPLLNKYDKKRHELERDLRDGMNKLREALKGRSELNLKESIDKLDYNHGELQRINDEEWAEVKKILAIEQQAKFIIFKQEFDMEMRRIISDVKGRKPERMGKELH
ncbi:MAG: hypothetical protein HZA14_08030 [Nitrospirae bacterium]|nr:hypothetical protein [Nitrospirota bacterium]